MAKARVAVALDEATLRRLDGLVRQAVFPNRSRGIQIALDEKLARLDGNRLARECAKLDPVTEQELADEGLPADLAVWPAY
jgi:metal-responsive CopG/Arc/MetJ family transcriptional regulator